MPTFERLQRATLRKLQPGQSISEHGITYTRLDGDGRWSVNVMVARTRHHVVVGLESEGYTRTQAEDLVSTLRAKKAEKRHGIATKRGRALTVASAADDYLEYLREHAGKDLDMKATRLRLHLVRLLGAKRLDQLEDADWSSYTSTRRSEGATDATVNRERSVLLHLLRLAVKRRLLRAVPCQLDRQKESAGRLIYLEPDQLRRLVDAARQDESPHSLPFVMIAGYTGMRHEPVLALRARDIDIDRRTIWIAKDKAGQREQPMPQILADYLRPFIASLQPDDWLFPSARSKRGRVYQMSSQFARCVARAGLPADVTPHTLRHTVASNAARAGLDAATIAALGGWKTRAMAERYTHSANLATAMDALERRLQSDTVTPKLQRTSRRHSRKPLKTRQVGR